jgi:hypothetical protein
MNARPFLSATLLFAFCVPQVAVAADQATAQDDDHAMSFFITSVGSGKGGDLGGLAGADAHCQALAEAAGAGAKTWRAYLGQSGDGAENIDPRSRIGTGPWYNAKGQLIAQDATDLHLGNHLRRETGLDENGQPVKARGDTPNQHDILTGARPDGTAFPLADGDRTCGNWTSSGEGSAMVGHFDRWGGGFTSWNSAHPSRGCSVEALNGTGGNGYFYCFASD